MRTKKQQAQGAKEIRSATIAGVRIVRHASGHIEYRVPTSINMEGLKVWRETNKQAIKEALESFDKPLELAELVDETVREAVTDFDPQLGELQS